MVRIEAQPGERVKKGDALAAIESPDVGNAFSDLAKAQADLIAAEHDFKRQKELYDAHAGSQRDFESAQDNYAKPRPRWSAPRRRRSCCGAAARHCRHAEFTLRAPIEGEVIARNVNPGAEVQGQYSGGTAVELFTIGELDHVWVIADVFEMDLARVKRGPTVSVKVVAYPDKVFTGHGRLDLRYARSDHRARRKVRCKMDNADRELKPEMYATVITRPWPAAGAGAAAQRDAAPGRSDRGLRRGRQRARRAASVRAPDRGRSTRSRGRLPADLRGLYRGRARRDLGRDSALRNALGP